MSGRLRGTARLQLDSPTRRDCVRDALAQNAHRDRLPTCPVIQLIGDSMEPILAAGDDVIVDRCDGSARLRDGIYVLRADDQLLVKRLARVPTRSGVVVHSDNPAYPSWEPKARNEVDIVGRVLWFGRKVG